MNRQLNVKVAMESLLTSHLLVKTKKVTDKMKDRTSIKKFHY